MGGNPERSRTYVAHRISSSKPFADRLKDYVADKLEGMYRGIHSQFEVGKIEKLQSEELEKIRRNSEDA